MAGKKVGSVDVSGHPAASAVHAGDSAYVCNLSKVTPPTLHRPYLNRRLFARLDAATTRPVVWVHGPPGAGKTTLVASYLTDCDIDPFWYRLDQDDADPATLFVYLDAARRRHGAPSAELPRLTSEFRASVPLFTRRFFRSLFAGPAHILVFDDYHEVASEAVLHECLPHGLEEVPVGSRVIIISRTPPPRPFARLRLNGQVDVVEPSALRMTVDEASGLARRRGADIGRERVEQLVGRTQGWTAGLILLLEAGGATHSTTAGQTSASEVLFDYFAGEILQRMDPSAQRDLCVLSLMPAMTSSAARHLTGTADIEHLLEDFRRRNYFLTRDLGLELRYRFHPLFRDFLLAQVVDRVSSHDLTILRIRAAALLEEDGQAEAAVTLLAEGDDFDALAALIRRRGAILMGEGRNDTLVAWISKLPSAQIAADGWLSYWRGAACVSAAPAEAIPHLRNAFAKFEAQDDATGQFLAWADLAEGVRADVFGDMTRFDSLIVSLRGLIARYPEFPSPAVTLKIAMGMAAALARRTCERDEIERWRTCAMDAADQLQKPNLAVLVRFWFAVTDLHDSNYVAARSALEACPDPMTLDHFPLAQYFGLFAHAIALVWRQKYGDCEAFMAEAIKRLEPTGFRLWLPNMTAYAVNDACRREDVPASTYWLRRTEAYADQVASHRGVHYHYVAAQHHLMVGDLYTARHYADVAVTLANRSGWNTYIAVARQVRALVLREEGAFSEALHELDRLDDILSRSATRSVAFSAQLMRAELYFATGAEEVGRARLAEAMAMGRRRGERFVMLHAAGARRVCALAVKFHIEPDYVRSLIRSAEIRSPEPHDEDWPWPIKISAFGDLSIVRDDIPLVFPGKTPKRLILLLKAIVAYGARDVPEEKIIDSIWPDEDGDAAHNALKIAVHRLRKLLGGPALIVWQARRLGLDPAACWLDIWAFEHHLRSQEADEPDCAFQSRLQRGLALYRGDFLAGDDHLWWVSNRREKLLKKHIAARRDARWVGASAGSELPGNPREA